MVRPTCGRLCAVSTNPAPTQDETEQWKLRFRAARMTFPQHARKRPDRAVFACNASGTVEMYAWDRGTGEIRQMTARPAGTPFGALDPRGQRLWWFDDDGGNEFGVWNRQPFEGDSPPEAAAPSLGPSYLAGLALGVDGSAVIGRSVDDGASIHWLRSDGTAVTIYQHREDAEVSALSADDSLLAISHSEHGDARHKALRVLRLPSGGAGRRPRRRSSANSGTGPAAACAPSISLRWTATPDCCCCTSARVAGCR